MKKNKGQIRQNVTNTRKAIRKQKRLQKKVHRQEHYMKKKSSDETPTYVAGRFVKRPADSPERETRIQKKKKKPQLNPLDILSKERQKDINETKRLQSQMEEQRKKVFLQANEEEDKIIKKLEKQLGLKKSKNKKSYFADDGLDYLLEICDRATSEQIVAAEKHLADVDAESDFEEDLAVVTGKEISSKKKSKSQEDKNDEPNDDLSGNDSENELDTAGSEDFEDGSSIDSEESDDGDEEKFSDDEEMSDIDEKSDLSDEPEEQPPKSKKAKITRENDNGKKISITEVKKNSKPRIIKEDDLSKVFSDDEVSHLSGDDDDDMEHLLDDKDPEKVSTAENSEKPDVWEDIYGRKRDKEGNIIKEVKGTYIPPHLRNKATDKDMTQLNRQIKSVLNKLAGANLHWACRSIEALYGANSAHAVNSSLWQEWASRATPVERTPPRLLAEHAALIAVLHADLDNEIGAYFLQELAKKFDELMKVPQPMEDKTLDNLVCGFAHLYSFKIFHASLLYDVLSRLLEELTEKNIECVVAALGCVGGVLRKDEPLALKTFIQDTQGKVTALNIAASEGSRIKFLLEVLMAVKNNNLTKIPNYDPSYGEQLRKQIRSVIRRGNYVTPLHIRLEDLLKAEERGKWWVVGSAWEGTRREETIPASQPLPLPSADQKLLELARKQRMNTDVRRSIFCVIMAAEDYMDAFEKLQHLGLRGQQEKEVVHVLLACCLQEKVYNPYYAVLALKLCNTDRKYQLSIQFSTWDKIKELKTLAKHSVTNLAQLLVHLILAKGLPLSVLKVIQFSDLNKHTVKFMRQILLAIILNADLQASLEVFHRISKPPKLHMFRESVKLFIQHFLLKNASKSNVLSDQEMALLKERSVEVEKILTMHESKLRL
ncbi:hypothetical protein evm_007317 [Chilo suppressalis]|nr:hypothetical protein evm_007317 [Chilo suppressalis]